MKATFDPDGSLTGLQEIHFGTDADSICRALQASLSEYLERDFQPALCTELEQHLGECTNCRVFFDTLQKTILLYRALPRKPMPQEARARLIKILSLTGLE